MAKYLGTGKPITGGLEYHLIQLELNEITKAIELGFVPVSHSTDSTHRYLEVALHNNPKAIVKRLNDR